MKPDTRSFYVDAVQRVIDQMTANLDDAADLERMARAACLSPFHFHRMFRGMVGETPLELMRRLRIERAAWQLGRTAVAITEVAFDAGYETHEAFTRAFRAAYNTSPSGFRKRKYKRIEIAATCGVHFDCSGRAPAFMPRESGGRTMDVQIKDKPEVRVAAVRHIGPYNQIVEAFSRLDSVVRPAGLLKPGTQMIAIYHDDPESTPTDRLRADAAISVPPGEKLPNGVTEQRVPAGKYACAIHAGPYEQLGDSWARFMGEWLPASGYRMADGVSYEVYLNNPMTEPDKQKLRTEMCLPISG
jgi:AraC family transcriptional regulator